ncbi:MAG: DNA alkylation repair protein [Lachnospiraceae bacterium]|nr:DNA alkylation repair protein [Lachnospiraceae bacterium]
MSTPEVQNRLLAMQDLKYKEFHCKLMPTVDPDTVIGVRTPDVRKLAKELHGSKEASAFLNSLPHQYYDENNLHGFLIEKIKDYDECIIRLNEFLPHINNWATCDFIAPKVFKKHLSNLLSQIKTWLASNHVYTVRFGIGMLMKFFLDEAFSEEYPKLVASVRSEEYYINMMIAWYFATALAKQYDVILPYLEEHRLDTWTHNKTIQKAVESFRITAEQKAYLKTLKM